ncbi:unnamed protein product [Lactuca virosa]|uniref:Uncharacterized protein n=1 Tax=Lactuca virosa TaxID=75947 RepID=A0AAU9M7L1_9ASTR|nr:unnamed protein product [Lactuca virosa]
MHKVVSDHQPIVLPETRLGIFILVHIHWCSILLQVGKTLKHLMKHLKGLHYGLEQVAMNLKVEPTNFWWLYWLVGWWSMERETLQEYREIQYDVVLSHSCLLVVKRFCFTTVRLLPYRHLPHRRLVPSSSLSPSLPNSHHRRITNNFDNRNPSITTRRTKQKSQGDMEETVGIDLHTGPHTVYHRIANLHK